MSEATKVTVSAGELALLTDRNIILTKRAVTEKASALFSNLIPAINKIFQNVLSSDKKLSGTVPKISKGENYRGFPYVIMDYPASFEKENIFAVRTMFLWGHFFSIQLHLSGEYKKVFQENIFENLMDKEAFFIAAGEKEWDHHFEEDNYIPYRSCTISQLHEAKDKDFFKIALKYELHQWNMMQSILPEGYKKLSGLLNIQY